MANQNIKVSKVSLEREQEMKDELFLKIEPEERLKIHEQLRKKIWGAKYNKTSWKGLRVTKRPAYS